MVANAAFEHEEGFFKASKSDGTVQQKLRVLSLAGFVTTSDGKPGFTHSRLTRHALQHLTSWQGLARPKQVFELSDARRLEDYTDWELLRSLEIQGFEMQVAPQKTAQRRALQPLCNNAERRVWYCSGVDISRCRSYLQCLLRASEVVAASPYLRIYHLQPAKYYKSILSGEDTDGLPAIEDADDGHDPAQPALELDIDTLVALAPTSSEPDQLKRRREGRRQNMLRVVKAGGSSTRRESK
jgi:hypothetical protein